MGRCVRDAMVPIRTDEVERGCKGKVTGRNAVVRYQRKIRTGKNFGDDNIDETIKRRKIEL